MKNLTSFQVLTKFSTVRTTLAQLYLVEVYSGATNILGRMNHGKLICVRPVQMGENGLLQDKEYRYFVVDYDTAIHHGSTVLESLQIGGDLTKTFVDFVEYSSFRQM